MKTHKTRTFLFAGALLAVTLTGANLAQAQTCSKTWNGSSDFWNNPDDWRPRGVPGPTDDVCITSGDADGRTTPSISVNSIFVGQNAVLVFGSGTVSVATTVTIQGGLSLLGTNTLSASSVDIQSASLVGYGTIQSSLTNDGYVAPQSGNLTVMGDYTQTSSGELSEQWGYAAILNVDGNATLSGFLVVHFDFKNPPKSGSTYTTMTFGSRSGTFTDVSPGTAEYTKNSVVVKF